MKSALTALILTIVAVPAFADEGNLTQNDLNQLGLSSIQVMTDADGLAIRGTGGKHGKHGNGGSGTFAFVAGASQVSVNIGGSSASSVDGGAAGSVNKYKSSAGQVHASGAVVSTPVGTSWAIAGGFSGAKAGSSKY
jgi:hypothetical protein